METLKPFLQEKITLVLEEALENMAFISVEESSAEEVAELSQQFRGVNLLINEPTLFEMHLNIANELLLQLAENIYAMEPDELSEQLTNDLLAEILNTVAGLFMTAVLPPDTSFTLGLPELSDNSEDDTDLKFYYIAEDYPLTIAIKAADIDGLKSLMNN